MSSGSLQGWVAIITGCGYSDGIGAATARTLCSEGASVLVTDLDRGSGTKDDLDSLVEELRRMGSGAESFRADITNESSCKETVAYALKQFGRLDILVNNAGADQGADAQSVADVPADEWRRVINVNLNGAFLMSRSGIPAMLSQRRGRIVSIASIAAIRGLVNRAAYSASKSGLLGLTRALAMELAPAGITVNAVCPGSIETRRARSKAPVGGDLKKPLARPPRPIPLGDLGSPQDIADAVTFLASPKAKYITGQMLVVDGGLAMAVARVVVQEPLAPGGS